MFAFAATVAESTDIMDSDLCAVESLSKCSDDIGDDMAINGQDAGTQCGLVLEIFAGCAALSRHCAKRGFRMDPKDIAINPDHDMTMPSFVDAMVNFIRTEPSLSYLHMGNPCSSFSMARFPKLRS